MDRESKIALIISQAAMLNAEIAMAQAENAYRERCGNQVAYGGDEMQAIIQKYEYILGVNAVIAALKD